jgi:hypothetical protein
MLASQYDPVTLKQAIDKCKGKTCKKATNALKLHLLSEVNNV